MTSTSGLIELIKHYEGLSLKAYTCPSGVLTIGYGHTEGVKEGDEITEEQAEGYLWCDVMAVERELKELLQGLELTPYQWDSLVSFCYNIGVEKFKASTCCVYLRNGNLKDVPNEIRKWVYSHKNKLLGLIRRRETEARLFEAGSYI